MKINFNLLLLVIMTVIYILVHIGLSMPIFTAQMISEHFTGIGGFQLYFCKKRDAVSTMKSFLNRPHLLSSKTLETVYAPKEIILNFKQPQVMGILVDITCTDGISFLNESSEKFNATYQWLLWTTDKNYTLKVLHRSRVITDSRVTLALPFNNRTVRMFDLYRMHLKLPFVMTEIEQWFTNGTYVHLSNPPERKHFQGVVIPASLLLAYMDYDVTQSISPLLDKSFMPGIDGPQRYGLAIFLHIAEIFNITYKYTLAKTWGYPQKNGSWTGMMDHIHRDVAEVCLAPAQLNFGRDSIVDYLMTLYLFRCSFIFKQPKSFGSSKALILPLNYIVWLCILITIVIGASVYKLMSKYDDTVPTGSTWGGSAFSMLSALSQQGMPDNPQNNHTRLFFFIFLMFTYITLIYYNISILNALLLPSPNAIQNIEQLLASDIRLGVEEYPYFRFEVETWNDSLTKRVREKLQRVKPPHKMFYSVENGIVELKKGHFAFYNYPLNLYEQLSKILTNSEIATLTEVEKYRPRHLGAIVKDNSPYKEVFKRMLLLMRERGIISRERDYWFISKPEFNWQLDAISVGLEPLGLAYFTFLAGLVAAVIFFTMEMFSKKSSVIKSGAKSAFT